MARDKEWEARMQGMIYAYNIVKDGGKEALEADLRRRNFLKAPMKFTSKQLQEFYHEVTSNLYNNMMTGVLYTLHDKYRFGQKRLEDFKRAFDYNVKCTLDLDYMGEHYVKMEDYAIELNSKFGMGIDIARVAASQDSYDEKDEKYHTCEADRVVKELREHGYPEAAEFIRRKIECM